MSPRWGGVRRRPEDYHGVMLSHAAHVALALGMLVLAAVNAWLMLEAFGGRTPPSASRRRATLHRWIGRAYVATYVVLLVSMVRMALTMQELGAVEAVHAALGLALLPLLLVKILIVRRYPPLQGALPLLGTAVLVLTFVTVGLGLLAGRSEGRSSAATGIGALPDHPGRTPFLQYCGQCHAVARPLDLARQERPDAARWQVLVAEMRQRASSRGRRAWTPEEGQAIVAFLVAVGAGEPGPGGSPPASGAGGDDRGRGRGRGRDDDDRAR